ncbi:alkaline phosphatase family protein [Alkaliphilus peptidifermentans]|uniref:Type I phosphodiesterase / nucleotide pyrophosphatase n=1 Tax=Alkaliphilus peptidifermentans DSM 18978 TaxID=1120976 RepID=A0A1G5GLD8_9FIRM|nr:alkaline phosphatase family protein [Alkaliphilus peptidifermentans]SCY52167.1 Type I phosphodiesterase / nucleotide pyrophosphatase [Alkaliphilus peptidifermentans DSM 18978]
MNFKNQLGIAMLLVVSLFIGLFLGKNVEGSSKAQGYFPTFMVVGDVKQVITIDDKHDFPLHKMEHRGITMDFFSLEHIIEAAVPIVEDFEVLLVGGDGLISKIDKIDDCSITFSDIYGWEFVNKSHPISSNIKMVKEIVVVSTESNWKDGLNIINVDGNILNITVGQLYLQGYDVLHNFEGTSTVEKNGNRYDSSVYTTKKIKRIKDLVDLSQNSRLLTMGAKGDYGYVDINGYIELKENKMNYVDVGSKEKISDIKGIFIDPPLVSIMDTYHDALHYINRGEKVLIFYIDGLGYHQYIEAMDNGYAPFFKSLPKAEKATSVYRPVTNAGFAAMITGEPPALNGVYSRNQRELKVPTIFGAALELDKRAALIQGTLNVLNTEINPILNMDTNNNSIADDEVYERALSEINKGYDLMLIHFKAIDIYGHSNGDIHPETMNIIMTIDKYVEDIVNSWQGKVIITSDHGMHSTEEGGSHGAFMVKDMVVPYLIIEGGLGNE